MTAQMSLIAEFCGEYLVAILALIFDPFVFLHVNCIIRSDIEAFSTLVTVVAVLPGMYLHVLIQMPSGGIVLFTQSAVESVSVFFLLNRSTLPHLSM